MAIGISKTTLGIIGAGAGGALLGGAVGYIAGNRRNKKRKSKRKAYNKNVRKRGSTHSRRKRGFRYTPHTAGKRKDRSHRRIRQTSNGQPYIILANGRARFISKKSARISRKRSGGRY